MGIGKALALGRGNQKSGSRLGMPWIKAVRVECTLFIHSVKYKGKGIFPGWWDLSSVHNIIQKKSWRRKGKKQDSHFHFYIAESQRGAQVSAHMWKTRRPAFSMPVSSLHHSRNWSMGTNCKSQMSATILEKQGHHIRLAANPRLFCAA